MRYRQLGRTGLSVSEIAFGAGPVPALMTTGSAAEQQAVIAHALQQGINWFDTAAGYGAGKSEAGLGAALAELRPEVPFHVATKCRLNLQQETDLRPLVVASVRASLERLQLSSVTLLQLHNSVTANRGDEPTSVTPDDVLGPQGVLAALEDLRAEGLIRHFGLTGIGQAAALREVMQSRRFDTIQAPFHLLNPSALLEVPWSFREPDYQGFLRTAAELGMGLFAIRAYAAGALLCASPSGHTLTTPFFPLALYERDLARANTLSADLGSQARLRELALRFVLSQAEFSSVILGLSQVEHIDEACRISELGPLSAAELAELSEHVQNLHGI